MNRKVIGFVLGGVLAVAAGCATTASLHESTVRLDDRASHFYSQLRYEGDDSRANGLSRDAQALASSSHDLSREVDHDSSRDRAKDHFEAVARDYDRLHEHLASQGYAEQNKRVLEDFDRVTEAFHSVERSMGEHPVHDYDRGRRASRN
jgi:uncharacterized membrane protein YccC